MKPMFKVGTINVHLNEISHLIYPTVQKSIVVTLQFNNKLNFAHDRVNCEHLHFRNTV